MASRRTDDAEIDRLRAEYRASRAGEYLRRVIGEMPPLTAAEIDERPTIRAGQISPRSAARHSAAAS